MITAISRQNRWVHGLPLLMGMVLILCLFTGCATTPECRKQSVPQWLQTMPVDETYFYGIGVSGRTRKVQDAWSQAANRARAELGRTIVSHVSSNDLIISTSRGEYSRQLIDILSDTELNYTEIIERWFDQCGSYGPPDHYYVLIRMKKTAAAAVLRKLK